MVVSIDAKRTFEKNPHFFIIKFLKTVGIEGIYSAQ